MHSRSPIWRQRFGPRMIRTTKATCWTRATHSTISLPETLDAFAQDCDAFQRDHAKDLGDAYEGSVRYNDELAGHDYWLTRNGHGAGFWDRGLGPVGDRLADACRHHPIDLYVHDGKVHA